jgi:parallel beta-helix repeat protein
MGRQLMAENVLPIFPGENLWQIVARIGTATETIVDKVCNLDNSGCDFLIKKSDFNGDTLTLSAPGVYCLAESIDLAITPGIVVASDNVLLDLNQHVLKITGGDEAIHIVGRTCVTVKNGSIQGSGGGIKIAGSSNHVTIQDIKILGSTGAHDGIQVDSSDDIAIEHCQAHEGARDGFRLVAANRVTLKQCSSNENTTGHGFNIDSDCNDCCLLACKAYNNTGGSLLGVGFNIDGARHVLTNCVANANKEENFQVRGSDHVLTRCSGSGSTTVHGYDIIASNCVLDHCNSLNNALDGFKIQGKQNRLESCTATENGSEGFRLATDTPQGNTAMDTVLYECAAISNGVEGFQVDLGGANHTFNRCSATGNGSHGFDIVANGCILRDCTATGNNNDGFKIQGPKTRLQGCVANQNTSQGFRLAIDQAVANNTQLYDCAAICNTQEGFRIETDKNTLRNCSATENGANGICIEPGSTDNIVMNCDANDNTSIGIFDQPGVGSSRIVGNVARCNSVQDYSRIDAVLIATGDAAIAAATNAWINVAG